MKTITCTFEVYRLISELKTTFGEYEEKNIYELVYIVDHLGSDKNTGYVYDKQLGMYFEAPNSIANFYEVETKYINLNLSPSLKKSENLNRKLFYRYDFIKLKVLGNGKVHSVLNADELKEVWKMLKSKIHEHHKGEVVDEYLLNIDKEMNTCEKILPALGQYNHFGLLFPSIPMQHSDKWEGERAVRFSPFEKEKFTEYCKVSGKEKRGTVYQITGDKLPESNTNLIEYSGTIIKKTNELLPLKAFVKTVIEREGLKAEWIFKLERV